jgi:indole-3-glycerol phosphate synthase
MLDTIMKTKLIEIMELQHNRRDKPLKVSGHKASFIQALSSSRPRRIIAEYKPGSPSQGLINKKVSPSDMASVFQAGQAVAVSVLTDKVYFHSSLEHLEAFVPINVPLLRKDFIIDPLQIEETARTPASALLLITRLFHDTPEVLTELVKYTYDLGMEPVVEIHDLQDLRLARQAQAACLLVNHRDLKTLSLDFTVSERLISLKKANEVWICASGLERPGEIKNMHDLGYDACLIGTSIMKSSDPLNTLKSFVHNERSSQN